MGMDDCISNSGHIGYCFVESQNNGSVDETDTNLNNKIILIENADPG